MHSNAVVRASVESTHSHIHLHLGCGLKPKQPPRNHGRHASIPDFRLGSLRESFQRRVCYAHYPRPEVAVRQAEMILRHMGKKVPGCGSYEKSCQLYPHWHQVIHCGDAGMGQAGHWTKIT